MSRFSVPLEDLEDSARVARADQHEVQAELRAPQDAPSPVPAADGGHADGDGD